MRFTAVHASGHPTPVPRHCAELALAAGLGLLHLRSVRGPRANLRLPWVTDLAMFPNSRELYQILDEVASSLHTGSKIPLNLL